RRFEQPRRIVTDRRAGVSLPTPSLSKGEGHLSAVTAGEVGRAVAPDSGVGPWYPSRLRGVAPQARGRRVAGRRHSSSSSSRDRRFGRGLNRSGPAPAMAPPRTDSAPKVVTITHWQPP